MLSIGKLGAGQERYYESKVAEGVEDYYSGEGEGYWLGEGAAELELAGKIEPGQLGAMLTGLDPLTGGPLGLKEATLLMADENPTAQSADCDPPAGPGDHIEDQALALDRLLVHWPTHLQESDLQREAQFDGDEFDQRDRLDRAIQQLFWAGLVSRCGDFVIPTRAAIHFRHLSDQSTVDL